MRLKHLVFSVSLLFCISTWASNDFSVKPYINYVSVPVILPESTFWVPAQMRIPKSATTDAPAPAVVILHSTFGVDSTGAFYARALNRAGIATLELDMWSARGLSGGSEDRPAFPQETLPDAFAALAFLASQPTIAADKIGLMGFSWGGVVTMLSATEQVNQQTGLPLRFAAHVAHYPLCWGYNNVPGFEFENLTAPVLIQTGDLDDYDLPGLCESLAANLGTEDSALVSVKSYKNAYHAWDRLEPEVVVFDPAAYLGAGGQVTISPNKRIAKKSRKKAVKFFKSTFGL